MELLVQLGAIVVGFCVFVSLLEGVNSRRKRERDLRVQLMLDDWRRSNREEHDQGPS